MLFTRIANSTCLIHNQNTLGNECATPRLQSNKLLIVIQLEKGKEIQRDCEDNRTNQTPDYANFSNKPHDKIK